MFKRIFLVLLLLLPCVCQAGEYSKDFRSFAEQTGHHNYNFRLGYSLVNMHREKGYYYSFDWLYFRFMKDTDIWQVSTPILFMASFMGMHGSNPNPDKPIGLFDPGWTLGALIPTLPLMLMNPTVGLVSEVWGIGVGYNTDLMDFILTSHPNIYFAPKIQLGWVIAQDFLFSMILSYQVADCFTTKRGFHLGLSLAFLGREHSRPLEIYNRSDYGITVRLVSKTTGKELKHQRHYIRSHSKSILYKSYYEGDEEGWRTVIEEENGLVMQVFPIEYRKSPSDSLDKMTPLKEWYIPDWESVKNVKGDYYYP